MPTDRNPQAEQMGDESMFRTLAHQAEAIWPQERLLFDRYGLAGELRILDLGCGSGEITRRLAQRYPQARLLGIDILEVSIARARSVEDPAAARIEYQVGDAFALALADAAFDLVVCRHVSQAVPHFERVLQEIRRVLRPGGVLHLLSEDYGMLHQPRHARDLDRFWLDLPLTYLAAIGCDGRIGRHTPALLQAAGFDEIRMDYVVVDTLRVPRATFGGILRAWRDGYVAPLAQATGRLEQDVRADFDAIIALIETPPNYVVWQVPVASARRPD
jgi:ubiquinone/menaquinone biosynthesis C-methylase UbiE